MFTWVCSSLSSPPAQVNPRHYRVLLQFLLPIWTLGAVVNTPTVFFTQVGGLTFRLRMTAADSTALSGT